MENYANELNALEQLNELLLKEAVEISKTLYAKPMPAAERKSFQQKLTEINSRIRYNNRRIEYLQAEIQFANMI